MTFSLETQIAEVNLEIKKRRDVYAHLVNTGKMSVAAMDCKLAAMSAVRDTLAELQAQRAAATH